MTAAARGPGSGLQAGLGSLGRTGLRVDVGRRPGHGSSLESHRVPASSQAAAVAPREWELLSLTRRDGTRRPGPQAGRWYRQCGLGVLCRMEPPAGGGQPPGGSPSGQRRRGREGPRDSSQGPLVCKRNSHRKPATSAERRRPAVFPESTPELVLSSPNSSLLLKTITSHLRTPSHETPEEGCSVEDTRVCERVPSDTAHGTEALGPASMDTVHTKHVFPINLPPQLSPFPFPNRPAVFLK